MTFAKVRCGVDQPYNSRILVLFTFISVVSATSDSAGSALENKIFAKVRRECNEISINGKEEWAFEYLSSASLKVVANVVESVYCQSPKPNVNRNLDRAMSVAPFMVRTYKEYEALGDELLGFKLTWSSPLDDPNDIDENQIQVYENSQERIRVIAFRGSVSAQNHYVNATQVLRDNEIHGNITGAMFRMLQLSGALSTEPTEAERLVNPNSWKIRFVGHSKGCTDLLYLLHDKIRKNGIAYEYAVFFGIGTGVDFSKKAEKVFLWGLDDPSAASKHVFIQSFHDWIALGIHYLFKDLLKSDFKTHKMHKDQVRENNLIFIDSGKAKFEREHFMTIPSEESDDCIVTGIKWFSKTRNFFTGKESNAEKLDTTVHGIATFFMDHDLPMEHIWRPEHVMVWLKHAKGYPNPDRRELRKAVDEVRKIPKFRPSTDRKRPHTCQFHNAPEPSNRQETGTTWGRSEVPDPVPESKELLSVQNAPESKPVQTRWNPDASVDTSPDLPDLEFKKYAKEPKKPTHKTVILWRPQTTFDDSPDPPQLDSSPDLSQFAWRPPPVARRRLKMIRKMARLCRAEEKLSRIQP
jgi:hypothetical protein